MSLATLEAFLDAARADPQLQELLLSAPDAATLAAIARAAGYPLTEADWLQASGAEPEEQAAVAEPEPPPADPLTDFLHQAQGDEELRGALAEARDAAEVAAIARAAGYPITTADLWAASGASAEELLPPDPGSEPEEIPSDELPSLVAFLRQLEQDPQLQAALVEAADAAAVAEIARAAGHPLREADLWRASSLEPQDLHASQPAADPLREALTTFLHQAQGDPRLGELLAEAADAAAVAEIAQAAGYPITAADLWAASGAASEELLV
jgi:predicted ribosomally synthesized peptide with nif11-like leader